MGSGLRPRRRALLVAMLAAVALVAACARGGAPASASSDATSAQLAVRVVYSVPRDRPVRPAFAHAIKNAILELQAWYLGQVGKTFAIAEPTPVICHMAHPNAYFASGTWDKVTRDSAGCGVAPAGGHGISVVYADVDHKCNAPGPIGLGAPGLAILGRQDMNGLTGAKYTSDCGQPFDFPAGRYIGGLGHELGHAFGLPHPPGCDQGLPKCAKNQYAIMWLGYVTWPNTYFTAAEKASLRRHPMMRLTRSIRPVIHGGTGKPSTPPPVSGGLTGGSGCTSGSYTGQTEQGQTVFFGVACSKGGGTVTKLTFARVFEDCSPSGGQASVGPLEFDVAKLGSNGSFAIDANAAVVMHVTGRIAAGGEASGTITADGPNPSGSTCTSGTVSWTAST